MVDIRREELTSDTALALITALNAELRARYPEDGVNYFRLDPDDVRTGHGAFLVAWSADLAMGCGAVRLIDPHTAEIKRMYVRPEMRGRGVARHVLDALEREAKTLGATRLLLETGTRQPEAIALYTKAGFTPTGPFGEYRPSPLNTFMEKPL
jgi:putative acetyltransferase